MVLQHHEGITHKGELFTKCLEPTKFQEGLKLLKVRRPQLPPPQKKGKLIDFNLVSPPRSEARGRSAERGSESSGRRVSRTPSACRVSSAGVREEININCCPDISELPSVREFSRERGVAPAVGALLDNHKGRRIDPLGRRILNNVYVDPTGMADFPKGVVLNRSNNNTPPPPGGAQGGYTTSTSATPTTT